MLKPVSLACAAMLLAGTAMAQTGTTAPASATDPAAPAATMPSAGTAASAPMSGKFVTEQTQDEFRASKFVGLNVYGTDNQKIGDVNDVLMDAAGTAKAVVIGVGGFLGIGEKNVAVPFASLQWSNTPVRQQTAATSTTGAGSASGAGTTDATTTGSTAPSRSPAETAAYNGYPDHAVLSMTKTDLQNAPEFKYYAQTHQSANK